MAAEISAKIFSKSLLPKMEKDTTVKFLLFKILIKLYVFFSGEKIAQMSFYPV
jgi:hypothetical protein